MSVTEQEGQQGLALALLESKQPLGILPTRDFWYGKTQAKKHFLSKKHFATTMIQAMPIFWLLGTIAAVFPMFMYLTFPIGTLIYAGIVEKIVRRRIGKNRALRATNDGDTVDSV